jgi:TRAP-type mannitol/chloroaromatic compound transport system permease small subunit
VWQLKMLIPFAGFFLTLQGIAESLRCVQCLRDNRWAPRLHDVEELEEVLIQEHGAQETQEAR